MRVAIAESDRLVSALLHYNARNVSFLTLPAALALYALEGLTPGSGLALTVASLKKLFSPAVLTWLGIAFCLSQSAMFSGLNLGFFSVGRLRLEAEAESGNKAAQRVLLLRKDANLLLCTILWGNVSVNVLLALLSESVLAGVGAFAFSTIGITLFGEIFPQAYFSRHGIRVGALLAPAIRFYQVVLYLVAKPTAIILDAWIGPEGPTFLRERDMEIVLQRHIREADSEIGTTEGRGAVANPARAKRPSNKSWLRSAFSGTVPSSAA